MTKQLVFIALPAFGQQNFSLTTSSLMALSKALLANGWDYYFTSQSFPEIAELRNMLATIWYDRTEAEFMLMVDADMGFEPKLVLDMLAFKRELVGGAYPQKQQTARFSLQRKKGGEVIGDHMEVEGIGCGVMLIRRDCMKKLVENGKAQSDHRLAYHTSRGKLEELGCDRIIRAFDKIELEHGILSEDYSFCKRVRESGMSIWANIGYNVSHVGAHAFTACFRDVQQECAEQLTRAQMALKGKA
ncbi:MAG: hypothetical protein KGL39_06535 [Patescibacteria group bacterium]|nr:hypothetical protein [Patescibacteria group bacterium]